MPKNNKPTEDKSALVGAMDEKQLEEMMKKAGYVKLTPANIDKAQPLTIDMEGPSDGEEGSDNL
jgi:hypothetical protein